MWHVTTFAGGGSTSADGIGSAAGFAGLFGIAQSGDTLYVIDGSRHSLRTVHTTTARVGTIVNRRRLAVSAGYVNGTGTSARFNNPRGVVVTDGNTLYVADFGNHRIREVSAGADTADTQVSLLAGSGTEGYADGAGAAAQFNVPIDLAVSGTTLYVADFDNHRIRAINLTSPEKIVSTIAGDGTAGNTDGIGSAAKIGLPSGIVVSGDTLYVTSGSLIRKLEYREVGS